MQSPGGGHAFPPEGSAGTLLLSALRGARSDRAAITAVEAWPVRTGGAEVRQVRAAVQRPQGPPLLLGRVRQASQDLCGLPAVRHDLPSRLPCPEVLLGEVWQSREASRGAQAASAGDARGTPGAGACAIPHQGRSLGPAG